MLRQKNISKNRGILKPSSAFVETNNRILSQRSEVVVDEDRFEALMKLSIHESEYFE